MKDSSRYENFSVISGLGVVVIDSLGNNLFESSICKDTRDFLNVLYATCGYEESCRIAFIYGCYQARRFGGCYLFFAPSGLLYCAVSVEHGEDLSFGVLAGPFILTDHDDYMEYDIIEHAELSTDELDALWAKVNLIPYITAKKAHAVSELLSLIALPNSTGSNQQKTTKIQTYALTAGYSTGKEQALFSAIRRGDVQTANAALSDMISQMLNLHGGNIEILRSKVVEFTVLLSRVALKCDKDLNAFLGSDYVFLREIDEFNSVENVVIWLQTVSRRFVRLVFDFAEAKQADIILKAVDFIKRHYASKINLNEIAGHLYISKPYFCRIFKEATGQTPGNYVTYVRIEESKKLLSDPNIDIIDISDMVGYENQSYFTKIFKQQTGSTPAKYRRELMHGN
ncbi:MAG: AraC family transcriptional regulator [Oscillospiraceae bacterium]|nr:AraC family transcriptional regulator [Oscillospiraceae bacterium]